jgi:hypothetical protein
MSQSRRLLPNRYKFLLLSGPSGGSAPNTKAMTSSATLRGGLPPLDEKWGGSLSVQPSGGNEQIFGAD